MSHPSPSATTAPPDAPSPPQPLTDSSAPTPPTPPTGRDPTFNLATSVMSLGHLIEQGLKDTASLIEERHKQATEQGAKSHAETAHKLGKTEASLNMLTKFIEAIPQGMAECNRLLGKTEAMLVKTEALLNKNEATLASIRAAQKQLDEAIVTQSAVATGARRELWTEAAKFRDQVARQIRWFIRTPAILLALAMLLVASWLFLRAGGGPPKKAGSPFPQTSPPAAATASQEALPPRSQRSAKTNPR